MLKHRCLSFVFMLAAAGAAPLALSAAPSADPAHDHSHASERPKAPAASPRGNPDIDAQIAHLRAIRERLSRAGTAEERQALMAEKAQVMQEAMTTMRKASGMGGAGAMRVPKGPNKASAAQMDMCHGMTEQHMTLMQEMMQSMMEAQGMGGGMGQGMGQAMGGDMMKRQGCPQE